MRSLLYRDPPATPLRVPASCVAGRQESVIVIRKGGRLIRLIARDRVVVEDPYLMMVKAAAFAIKEGTAYAAQPVPRTVRDFLIKSNVGVV